MPSALPHTAPSKLAIGTGVFMAVPISSNFTAIRTTSISCYFQADDAMRALSDIQHTHTNKHTHAFAYISGHIACVCVCVYRIQVRFCEVIRFNSTCTCVCCFVLCGETFETHACAFLGARLFNWEHLEIVRGAPINVTANSTRRIGMYGPASQPRAAHPPLYSTPTLAYAPIRSAQ